MAIIWEGSKHYLFGWYSCCPFNDSTSSLPRDCRYLITMSTSHVVEYLGCGGCKLYIPFSSCETNGCFPTGIPPMCTWVIETADWIVLTHIPSWKRLVRNSRKGRIGHKTGSTYRSEHQLPCTLVCSICPFAPSSRQELWNFSWNSCLLLSLPDNFQAADEGCLVNAFTANVAASSLR